MVRNFRNQLITGILSSPIIYIPHFHYEFVDGLLHELLKENHGHKFFNLGADSIWEYDIARGIVNFMSKAKNDNLDLYSNVNTLLDDIIEYGNLSDYEDHFDKVRLFIFKNFSSPLSDPKIQSMLQTFASKYERGDYDPLTTIIICSPLPITSLPPELESIITVVEIGAPTEAEIHEYVDGFEVTSALTTDKRRDILRNDICRNLQGLQYYDVKQILASALVRTGGKLSEKTKELVLEEKKRVVKKTGIIEVIDTDVSFGDIGGMRKVRDELERKAMIYRHLREAQESRITLPKGILIIGMPGCGKSMIAKAVANEFGVSLLRLDISRLMGQYVGQSETNLRKALATAEAAHPCVLWIDEIEKAFAGSTGKGGEDMLVMRLMGHFLTWMQERKTPVYIVATANDVMRPEFMRKGRFDDVYFVNFPTAEERKEIFSAKLKKYRSSTMFDLSAITDEAILKVVDASKKKYEGIVAGMEGQYGGFSGAEIESIVNTVFEKKFVEYIDDVSKHEQEENYTPAPRKVTPQDFIDEAENIKSSVMAEQRSQQVKASDQQAILDKQYREKTNIERIREMQRTYKFTVATEGNDVNDSKD